MNPEDLKAARIAELVAREKRIRAIAAELLGSGSFSWREAILHAERYVDETDRRMECAEDGEEPYTHPYDNKDEVEEEEEEKKGGDDEAD